MAPESENFCLFGLLHLTAVNWDNAEHQRIVAACLVKGVYLLERNRQGSEAFAPPWWESFHFGLHQKLIDNADNSIFGAVFEFKPIASSYDQTISRSPRYVIAFRGTLIEPHTILGDLKQDFRLILNDLHHTLRSEIAMQCVRDKVAAVGDSDIWLAGHSLGSAMAMLAGKTMAKKGHFLKTFLFNPPFISPIERIKNNKVKERLRTAGSVMKAGFAVAKKITDPSNESEDSFIALSGWIPSMFVNPDDDICKGYIGYFKHRENMEKNGAGFIEKQATKFSIWCEFLNGKETDPLHLIPSANLIVNLTPQKEAHGIRQWWLPDMQLQSKLIKYEQLFPSPFVCRPKYAFVNPCI